MLLSKRCKPQERNLQLKESTLQLKETCRNMLHVANSMPLAALGFRKLQLGIQLADVNFKMSQKLCGFQVMK
jgi:hypothetical protein